VIAALQKTFVGLRRVPGGHLLYATHSGKVVSEPVKTLDTSTPFFGKNQFKSSRASQVRQAESICASSGEGV
jgi:hypothetical protein